MRVLAAALTVVLMAALPLTADVIHVDPSGGPGYYSTIQAGIDAASYGDTVLVACGTYHDCTHIDPGGQTACIIMKDGVVLTSEGADPNCVTVDAQTIGRCVYCGDVDPSTLIEGFTFINGRAPYMPPPGKPQWWRDDLQGRRGTPCAQLRLHRQSRQLGWCHHV